MGLPGLRKGHSRHAGPHLEHKPSWVTHPVFPVNWVPFPDVPNQVGT